MWRALKAPCRGYPAETETPEVRPAIPTRDNSGLKQFDPSRALSCQLVQGFFHPFAEEDGAGRCGPSCDKIVQCYVTDLNRVRAVSFRFHRGGVPLAAAHAYTLVCLSIAGLRFSAPRSSSLLPAGMSGPSDRDFRDFRPALELSAPRSRLRVGHPATQGLAEWLIEERRPMRIRRHHLPSRR